MARALEATMNRNGSIYIPEATPVILRGPKVSIFERIQRAADTLTHTIEHGFNKIQTYSQDMMTKVRNDRGEVLVGLHDARQTIANAIHATHAIASKTHVSNVAHAAGNLASHTGHYIAEHPKETAVGVAKFVAKLAPNLAVSIGMKIVGGAIAVPAIAASGVASGLNNLRQNAAIRKLDIFGASQVIRSGFDRNEMKRQKAISDRLKGTQELHRSSTTFGLRMSESTPLSGNQNDARTISNVSDGTDTSSILRTIRESRIGKLALGYMNLEKTVAQHVITRNTHVDRVMTTVGKRSVAQVIDAMVQSKLTRSQIEQHKIDAVVTRMTAATPAEREAARILHSAASKQLQNMKEVRRAGEGAACLQIHAERQHKQYLRKCQQEKLHYQKHRKRAFTGVVSRAMLASAGVRIVKSSITTLGMYLGLSAIHVHAANPLKNLADGVWGDVAKSIKHTVRSVGSELENVITMGLNAAPHGNAMAAELEIPDGNLAHVLNQRDLAEMPVTAKIMINHPLTGNPDQSFDDYSAQHFVPKAHKAVSAVSEHVVHDPQRDLTDMPNGGAQHLRPTADNHSLDHDETISPPKTAVISPTGASQNQPILNDSLGQNSDMSTHFDSTTPPIQSAPVEYVLTGPNLTASLYNDGIIGADAKKAGLTAVQYYSQSGSAAEMLRILHQNPDILDTKSYEILHAEVEKNPGISFGKLYTTHKELFIPANRLKAGSKIVLDAGSAPAVSGVHDQIVETVTIDQETSLSTFLTQSGLLGEEAKKLGPSQFFSQRDTAQLFYDSVLRVNTDKMSAEAYIQAQQYLADNPHATFGQFWKANRAVFEQLDGFRKGSSFVFNHDAAIPVVAKSHDAVGAVLGQNPVTGDKVLEAPQPSVVEPETVKLESVNIPVTAPFFHGTDEARDLTINFGSGVKAKVGQAILNSTDQSRWIDPYGDNVMTCNTIPDGGTVCAAHSGSVWSESKQQAINLPLEDLRKWFQGDKDTYRSEPQINGFLQTLAQDNRPISVTDSSGNIVAQYIFAGGKTASPSEYIDPYSEVMKSLYAKDSNLLQLCIHHQVKAWDVFEQAFRMQSTVPVDVQEAYRVMYDPNASLTDIDRVIPIIRKFLKGKVALRDGEVVDALALFNQYYAPAGPKDEAAQTAHGVVVKLQVVTS